MSEDIVSVIQQRLNQENDSLALPINEKSKKWQIQIVTVASTFLIFFMILIMVLLSKEEKDTLARIKYGRVKGTLEYLPNGETYISFKGIPYAKPPFGDLRYKAPEPPDNWTDIKHAYEYGNKCIQFKKSVFGSEDCLFLNVYTPSLNNSGLAVMVWFYGGFFKSGFSNSPPWGPRYLVEQGVIVVTANYRTDTLGFLSLGTKDIPGNAGLKDQVAVLEWVRDNIKQFGGDPNKVTIFGSSSGAAAVSFHMLSPMSKNLFRNMILHSGCFMNDWSFNDNSTEIAFQVGKLLGQDTEDVEELEAFFKTEPAENLVGVTIMSMSEKEKIRGNKKFYSPVIEGQFEGQESFITKPLLEILRGRDFNHVPFIIGYTDAEGIHFLEDLVKNGTVSQILDGIDVRMPSWIQKTVTKDEFEEVENKVRDFYFKNIETFEDALLGLTDLESDASFIYEIATLARVLAKFTDDHVYVYRFSFDGKNNLAKIGKNLGDRKGASHGDDMSYVFENVLAKIEEGTIEETVSRRLVRMWSNFAKFNDPVPFVDDVIPVKWTPYNGTQVNFLNIDRALTVEEVYPEEERFQFWDDIYYNISRKYTSKVFYSF